MDRGRQDREIRRLAFSEGGLIFSGLYTDDNVRAWLDTHGARVAQQPTGDKVRMVEVLLSGSVGDADMAAIVFVFKHSTPDEQARLRALSPLVDELVCAPTMAAPTSKPQRAGAW